MTGAPVSPGTFPWRGNDFSVVVRYPMLVSGRKTPDKRNRLALVRMCHVYMLRTIASKGAFSTTFLKSPSPNTRTHTDDSSFRGYGQGVFKTATHFQELQFWEGIFNPLYLSKIGNWPLTSYRKSVIIDSSERDGDKKMHHEFAVESYEYHVENFSDKADFLFIKNWCLEPEMVNFAIEHGTDKTRDIISTIKEMTGYRHPTDKQKAAIAIDMLRGRTAKDILLAVYGDKVRDLLPEEKPLEVDAEDAVAVELAKHGIALSDKRVAFGLMSEFLVDEAEFNKNTYRTTVDAAKNLAKLPQNGRSVDALLTVVLDERIAVTQAELRKLNAVECDGINFSAKPLELECYIKSHYAGNHKAFADAMGVAPSKVSEWKRLGWVAYEGKLWSSKRTLGAPGSDVEMIALPEAKD